MKMFSNKGKSQEPVSAGTKPEVGVMQDFSQSARKAPRPRAGDQKSASSEPSLISRDLHIVGNLTTTNDVRIEGRVEGDVQARVLTVGSTAEVKGHLRADELIVNGRIIGEVRGVKVRLNKSARVDGDVIHETISIEAGAYFEGSVRRAENPLEGARGGTVTNTAKPSQGGQKQQKPPVQNIAPKRIS